MINKKINKDNNENYFISFTPEAQKFFYNHKISKILNQKKHLDFFFNQNEYASSVFDLKSRGYCVIKNFFSKSLIKKLLRKKNCSLECELLNYLTKTLLF